ncbi:hypothetical protein HPB51_016466 [Rhipicephalus microplus]|uniref:Uncharacterized protein n=1 Tax=Rhipicephalus microplus TaxID=6941 RepID=A0A9J6DVC6_RHIMP|nr:hypothetical protein HPB51_016466 [Rhipicephalus microplus]
MGESAQKRSVLSVTLGPITAVVWLGRRFQITNARSMLAWSAFFKQHERSKYEEKNINATVPELESKASSPAVVLDGKGRGDAGLRHPSRTAFEPSRPLPSLRCVSRRRKDENFLESRAEEPLTASRSPPRAQALAAAQSVKDRAGLVLLRCSCSSGGGATQEQWLLWRTREDEGVWQGKPWVALLLRLCCSSDVAATFPCWLQQRQPRQRRAAIAIVVSFRICHSTSDTAMQG